MGHNADHHANMLRYTHDNREGKNNVVEQGNLYGNHKDNNEHKKHLLRLNKPVLF